MAVKVPMFLVLFQLIASISSIKTDMRRERINAGVCSEESTSDLEWDVCNKTNSSHLNHHCYCDQNCHLYDDCCFDVEEDDPKESTTNWSCLELLHSPLSVYGINSCPKLWSRVDIKNLCHRQHLSSYLQDVQVYSVESQRMYANIYCAACNGDSDNLMPWHFQINCRVDYFSNYFSVNKTVMEFAEYDFKSRNWQVDFDNQSFECSLMIEEFANFANLSQLSLRKCKTNIGKCPEEWSDEDVSQKCKSYTSYVYELNDNKDRVVNTYRNYHCAFCNGANQSQLTCFPKTALVEAFAFKGRLWYPMILDFNFGKGSLIGSDSPCFGWGQVYDPIHGKCVEIKCGRRFRLDRESNRCVLMSNHSSGENYLKIDCPTVKLTEGSDFEVTENGSVYVKHLDKVLKEGEFEFELQFYHQENLARQISICLLDDIEPLFNTSSQQVLSSIMLYLSIFCLILHLLVYSIVPKLQNLPGKNLMSLSASLLIANFGLVISPSFEADRNLKCVLVAIATHYFFLAAFFWMNVMAYDIHRTFTSKHHRRRSSSQQKYKFLKYSLYSWLSPAIIVLISATFDIGLRESVWRPLYGYKMCWISQRPALLVFFAVPLAVVITVNFGLFVLTATALVKTAEQTKIVAKPSDKLRFFLYVKLAFIMGLTWMFGFLAALSNYSFLWYPFIVFNGLQGAVIFFAFTFKPKVFHLLISQINSFRQEKVLTIKSDDQGNAQSSSSSEPKSGTQETQLT